MLERLTTNHSAGHFSVEDRKYSRKIRAGLRAAPDNDVEDKMCTIHCFVRTKTVISWMGLSVNKSYKLVTNRFIAVMKEKSDGILNHGSSGLGQEPQIWLCVGLRVKIKLITLQCLSNCEELY